MLLDMDRYTLQNFFWNLPYLFLCIVTVIYAFLLGELTPFALYKGNVLNMVNMMEQKFSPVIPCFIRN